MHLKILFFARIREALGASELTIELPDGQHWSAGAVARHLAAERGSLWERELLRPNTVIAINHCTADADTALGDGDELAYFPPVTGG